MFGLLLPDGIVPVDAVGRCVIIVFVVDVPLVLLLVQRVVIELVVQTQQSPAK